MLTPARHALFYAQNLCAAPFCQLKSRFPTLHLKHQHCICSRPAPRTVTRSNGRYRNVSTLLSCVGRRSHLAAATAQRRVCTNDQSHCLSITQRAQAEQYLQLVLYQNVTLNLTGVDNTADALTVHLEDSLALLPILDSLLQSTQSHVVLQQQASVIDVGSGGGLPGVILAIARPHWQVTLLDSLRKRCSFVEAATQQVGLTNVKVVWARAEEAGQDLQHREVYDVAVARAVARMRVLAELCLPFVRPGGHWLAAKGPNCQEEVSSAESAIKVLQGGEASILPVDAYGAAGQHTAVVVPKVGQTPSQYPRQAGKPNKRPL